MANRTFPAPETSSHALLRGKKIPSIRPVWALEGIFPSHTYSIIFP